MSMTETTDDRRNVPAIAPARLPYHPALQERFGVGQAEWRALVDAVFPLAKEPGSIILALSYCKARKLDPFKKPVHIVPMWNSAVGRMVETVWPGIGELRTTAFRTGQYAGRDEAHYGETITRQVGNTTMEFPEWCQVTVYRLLGGQRMPFPGPRVYWLESHAVKGGKEKDQSPNEMWRRRPFGQLDKCAEAAALRAAFPEEVGNEYAAEEMEGKTIDGAAAERAEQPMVIARTLAGRLDALAGADPETGEIIDSAEADTQGAAPADQPPPATETGEPQRDRGSPEAAGEAAGDQAASDTPAAEPFGAEMTAELALLEAARAKSMEGKQAFDFWINRLRPEQLDELQPHMSALAKMAREVSKKAAE